MKFAIANCTPVAVCDCRALVGTLTGVAPNCSLISISPSSSNVGCKTSLMPAEIQYLNYDYP